MMVVHDLSVTQNNRLILSQVNIKLTPGTITVIVGPNGAGKSTLLKVMAGLINSNSGEVSITYLGQSSRFYSQSEDKSFVQNTILRKMTRPRGRHNPDIYRLVSWYGDHSSLAFPYTIEHVVMMGRFPHHRGWPTKEDFDWVRSTLVELDLTAIKDRAVNTLSSGELQKTMLARAFANRPQVLLLDEPTSHLDPSSSLKLFQLLQKKRDHGAAVCLVLHNLEAALRVADKLVLMENGRVVMDAHVPKSTGSTDQRYEIQKYLERVFQIKICWIQDKDNVYMILSDLI